MKGEGRTYGNLGNAYESLGNYQKAIEYHEKRLKIAKTLDDRVGKGRAYGNLGITPNKTSIMFFVCCTNSFLISLFIFGKKK